MELEAKVELKILKPIHEVYEGIIDPERMSHYFITTGNGRMEQGKSVTWTWADHGGAKLDIRVTELTKDKFISFQWSATGVESLVKIQLIPIGTSGTQVKIVESGWNKDDLGIQRLVQQTHGWVHFLCGLKAFMEHGINIRIGAF